MLNHKPKPLILQIRKPLAYSLGSVCPSTLPLLLNPGLYRNHSKSPCVILLDSCHLEIIGSNVSPLDFSQACPSIRAYIELYYLEIILILPILEPSPSHLPCV